MVVLMPHPRGATTTGPDVTHPPTIFQNLGGGAVGGGGGPAGGRGGGFLLGSGEEFWPGVMGPSSQGDQWSVLID